MNPEEIRELAAVYALGALDGEDLVRFEALLAAGDPDAVAAVREFEGSLVALAAEAPAALPAGAKQALMDRIGPARGARPVTAPPRPPAPALPAPRRSWWPAAWAAAMAAGLAAIVVGMLVASSYDRRVDALAREADALRAELARQQATLALIRDPATQVVPLAGLAPAPEAKARMIWNAPLGGLLVAAGLPPAPEGKAYQLWAIAGQNAPVPAGVFRVDAQGQGSLRVPALSGVDKVDVFAVTLEPAGGVPAPTGQMYLAGKS